MKILLFILAIVSSEVASAKPKSNAELGAENPDLYDIMDWWRDRKLEQKKQQYIAEGMSDKQAAEKVKQDDIDQEKQLEEQTTFFAGAPFLGYNPYTSLLVGAGANISTYFGEKENTHLSAFNILAFYSINNQMSFRLINQIYFPGNKLFLTGFAQWSDSPGNTFGLGGNTPNSNAFELERGFIKLNQNVLLRAAENLYVGPVVTLDRRYKIRPSSDIPDDLDDNQQAYDELLNEIWYSYDYGTDGNAYTLIGGGITVLYDSRDNVNSPYKGFYLNANYQYMGGDYTFNLVNLEYRHYIQVYNKRNIIALWGMGNFSFGDTPYDSLPANGLDPMFASGRGYISRRYTGEQYLYGEVEYRRHIYRWFGLTGFFNAHSVTQPESNDFVYVSPAGGFGMRFKFNKQSRTTLAIDFGWGKDESNGIYFRFTDAF